MQPAANSTDQNTRAIAYLRAAVGILFLLFGEYKVFGTQFTLGGGFQHWVNGFLVEPSRPGVLLCGVCRGTS